MGQVRVVSGDLRVCLMTLIIINLLDGKRHGVVNNIELPPLLTTHYLLLTTHYSLLTTHINTKF